MNTAANLPCRKCVGTDNLNAMGFTVEHREHSMGSWHVVTEGMTRGEAERAAQAAGLVQFGPCVSCSAAVVARCNGDRTVGTSGKSTTVDAEMLAWMLSTKAR